MMPKSCQQLTEWLQPWITLEPEFARPIANCVLDSRQLAPGDVFIAIAGSASDGRQYIADALASGAVAVLTDTDARTSSVTVETVAGKAIPIIALPDCRAQLPLLVARRYGDVSRGLPLIGVTGTNGKTSICHLIAQLAAGLRRQAAVIGTCGNGFLADLHIAALTTPDILSLYQLISQYRSQGADLIAMEVSSHSLEQNRIGDLNLTAGIFTNLTPEHLDYHQTLENYAAAKWRLFQRSQTQTAIINCDDPVGLRWVHQLHAMGRRVVGYGLETHKDFPGPYLQAKIQSRDNTGIQVKLIFGDDSINTKLPLLGDFNVYNMLAAVLALMEQGFHFADVVAHIPSVTGISGRMQCLGGGVKPLVVVDYAHTPDALEQVLTALRPHTQGRLICVFGCGGDRDKTKRPLMGKIVEQLADEMIITDDNPRFEAAGQIVHDIQQGLTKTKAVTVIHAREHAIERAITQATAEDVVLIAGKGHETKQLIADEERLFSDVKVALEMLQAGDPLC